MAKISAIVLGAGLSQRMGGSNKMLLSINGKPLIQTVVEALIESAAEEIVVVANEILFPSLEYLSTLGITLIVNPDYKKGMTTSIKAGIRVSSNLDGYMICLGDQPLITAADYNMIISTFDENHKPTEPLIAVPFYIQQKGNPVIFSSYFKSQILTHPSPDGCKELIRDHASAIVKVDLADDHILRDIDTPEDYKNITQMNDKK
jgi:molybdenum cofactor cytidylyltransferase